MNHYKYFFCAIIFTSITASAQTEITSKIQDQAAVSVTIYNQNLALIKDQRKVQLEKGLNHLAFRGVSAHIKPETALLKSIDPKIQLSIQEQNFDFDLLTPQTLLEKHIGKVVKISQTNPATGKKTLKDATILSTQGGTVVNIDGQIVSNPTGRFIFPSVPNNLRDKPTLVTQVLSSSDKPQTLELSYLTQGLAWKADYVAELNNSEDKLDLTGWVTLSNNSGASYNNAQLQLVAGDIHQVQNQRPRQYARKEMVLASAMADGMSEQSLFEYHLYKLNRTTHLKDKQTKQLALLNANNVPVTKQYLLNSYSSYFHRQTSNPEQKLKIAINVLMDNNAASHLGIPLPKGTVRVYKNDAQNNALFIGEDRIDHTAKNDKIRLKLGNAFDVSAIKKQTSFKKTPLYGRYKNAYDSSYELEFNNAKDQAVTVTIHESITGNWQIVKSSEPYKKLTSRLVEWSITVPANSKQRLRYSVLIKN